MPEEINDSTQTLPNISNMRDFIFTITPKLKYEFHRDYKKALKELKSLNQSSKLLSADEKKEKQKFFASFEAKVKKAKERAEKEEKLNQELIISKAGQVVTYGSEVQLMHRDSGYFLISKNECSQTEQIGYKLEVSNEYNSRMVFTLLPRYKSRRLGDFIQFSDDIYIKNIKINSFLSVSSHELESARDIYFQETNPYV